jgi:nicotinamide-nucleotide amidase
MDVLKVDADIIDKYSVVSTQVAEAMALQAQKLFKTDYAISTTGNAGPTKGEGDAEVGTVCIALASPKGVFSEEFHLGNHRTKVINKAVNKAFELLQKEIFKN